MDENSVIIKDDVIYSLIKKAVAASEGAASEDEGRSVMKAIAGRKNKGITFERNEDKININIDIVMKQNKDILENALALQKRVYEDVETMSGLECSAVNINISDIEINENDEGFEGERK